MVSDDESVFIHAESPSQSLDFLPKTGILPYFQGDFQELLRIQRFYTKMTNHFSGVTSKIILKFIILKK